MGKKRNTASQRKSDAPPSKTPSAADMKQECERALTALRRGNHNKALRIMKEAAPKFDNSALFHRVAGTISVKVAGIIDNTTTKNQHLKQALESARRASLLSPNSVEYAHFYANLLLEVSTESKEYEEVVAECERALAVEDPNDPALDEFESDGTQTSFSAEAKEGRVLGIQSDLRSVIQRANIASLSSWVKNLGGEDKFRLIPMRQRVAEDPVETRYLTNVSGSGKRSGEIKKASKTVEEKRQEIEVKVAAARLLQAKGERGGGEDGNASANVNAGGSVSGVKGTERRRAGGARKSDSVSERKDYVKSFWNSMSFEMKQGLLSINVSNIRAYLDSLSNKDGGQAVKVFSEALVFGEMNHTWKFSTCCRCGERFADASDHIYHVIHEHLGDLLPKQQSVVPESVGEWEEMLISCSWEPLDLAASVRMLEDQCKSEASEFSARETLKEETDDTVSVEDMWESSFQEKENVEDTSKSSSLEGRGDDANVKENVEDTSKSSSLEGRGDDADVKENVEDTSKSSSLEGRGDDANVKENVEDMSHRKVDPQMYNQNNSWPLSGDAECAKLLRKISSLFQTLLRHKCLALSHLQKVIHYTMEDLQGLFPASQILSCGVDQTPVCICFLGASSLNKVAEFLQNVIYQAGHGKYAVKVSADDSGACSQVLDCEDRVTLDESASFLLLDENLLQVDSVKDEVGSGSSVSGLEKGGQSDSDALLSWIYTGPPGGEQLATWSRIKNERSQGGVQLLETLDKEFTQLQSLCDKKHDVLGYGEALQLLEELCLEECKKREEMDDTYYCSYESIFQKRKDELVEGDQEDVLANNRLELDAISNVLKDAESVHVTQYGYDDSYAGISSHHYDLEAGEEDWRSKDYFLRLDTCIETTLQRQKEQMSLEICKLDAQIMRKMDNMNQLELKLQPLAVLDYRFILLPLVKSFLRAHLEDLAEKDATEKSDAAREAFLAELERDSKKKAKSGSDVGKHSQEKAKDRKKNKDLRRIKESKGGSTDQLAAADQISLGTASDGDLLDTETLESESADKLRESEDDFQRSLELEEEERKLEETLAYQRRLENEAKQRRLAEQQNQNALSGFDDALDESGDVNVGIAGTSHSKQVTLPSKNVGADSEISSQRNLKDDICPGLPSSGGTIDEGLPFEQAGKRRKRRSKHQNVSFVKEHSKLEKSSMDRTSIIDQSLSPNSAPSQSVEDVETRTFRQLQAEEEKFQADMKKAVMQSLDTFHALQKMPSFSDPRNVSKGSEDFENFSDVADGGVGDNVNEIGIVGPGLQNDVGEYNCFLNVIIQSLWHLRRFKEEFLRRSASEHAHIGDPCVVCALFDILTALSIASEDGNREPVIPSALRIALSNLFPNSNFFQQGQMNDASEVLAAIFECLHRSFTSDTSLTESNGGGSWDCSDPSCIAHTLFGMDIFERMNCYNCGLESRRLKYTSFFHNINASALRTAQVTSMGNSFDDLMNLVEMNHQLKCDKEANGCQRLNHIHHILSNPPHVFTAVLGWQNTSESLEDIKTTLEALSTEIDIGVLYRGLDPQNLHRLVSVVCYYGQHYHCFAYSQDQEKWIMYDDQTVKVIGTWDEVLLMCVKGRLQPQVLFYEAVIELPVTR